MKEKAKNYIRKHPTGVAIGALGGLVALELGAGVAVGYLMSKVWDKIFDEIKKIAEGEQ